VEHPNFVGIQAAWQDHIRTSMGQTRSETGASVESDGVEGEQEGDRADGMHWRTRSTPVIGAVVRHHVRYQLKLATRCLGCPGHHVCYKLHLQSAVVVIVRPHACYQL
jgi:hypothetical protein